MNAYKHTHTHPASTGVCVCLYACTATVVSLCCVRPRAREAQAEVTKTPITSKMTGKRTTHNTPHLCHCARDYSTLLCIPKHGVRLTTTSLTVCKDAHLYGVGGQ